MSKYNKSIVASGHQLVSEAAAEILLQGGNAFDAMVAAGFASAVVEPALTSLGGGGLLVGKSEDLGQDLFFDFFVDTPGKGLGGAKDPKDFFPVTVDFSGSSQDFHIGLGSVAVPGTLKGLMHIHRRLGRMPRAEVLAPAQRYAKGHLLNFQQGHFLSLLAPIMTRTAAGKAIYMPHGKRLGENDRLCNHSLAAYLEELAVEGERSFYEGEIATAIVAEMREVGGLLTLDDLLGYEVHEKKPFSTPYRRGHLLTAGRPSMGGSLVGLFLGLLEKTGELPAYGSADYLTRLTSLMVEVERLREMGISSPAAVGDFLCGKEPGLKEAMAGIRLFSRGTTHISIADQNGNCASMTCSNGEGSGYFVPATGIMLNNMMGEDDLHPQGFHSSPPGQRVYSMMSPSLYVEDDEVRLVVGSGGSKRIRTAISQVLTQVVDHGIPLEEAVAAPRLYLDEELMQIEPGFKKAALLCLEELIGVNLWKQKDVYFGGVHAVIPGVEGAGDPRRGGSVAVVEH